MAAFLVRHPRVAKNLLAFSKRCANPLGIPYFSAVPYLCGTRAVKYALMPQDPPVASTLPRPSANYLRDALKERLAHSAARFDFMIQLRPEQSSLSIEDSSVPWPATSAPFRKVATVEVLQQEFDSPERRTFDEDLSFNPWRCLPQHRPLGGINRARRQVYRVLSNYRHDRNATPRAEPEPW